jgi:hypothetical protein
MSIIQNRIVPLATVFALAATLAAPAVARDSSKSKGEFENEGIETEASCRHSLSVKQSGGKFDLKIRDLTPSTDYELIVGGVPEAQFTTDDNGKAKLSFRTPPIVSSRFRELDFDPRGKQLAISDGTSDVLTTVIATTGESLGSSSDERVNLLPVASAGFAKARFRTRKDGRQDFTVEITGVAAGSYDLFVGGLLRGTINASSGRGEIEFKSAPSSGELLLDFDPRGVVVDIVGSAGLAFSKTFLGEGDGVTACAYSETSVNLTSTGLDPDASGDAKTRTESDCERKFDVEIEDVPVGNYDVFIDGALKGVLTVVDDGVTIEGELEFSNGGDDEDELLLDFEPVGALIEVKQGASTFFSGSFAGGTTSTTPGGACTAAETKLPLFNAGVFPAGSGDAEFKVRDDCEQDFDVEIEDVPVGNYDVYVDGAFKGVLTVVNLGGDVEGELEFGTGDDLDELPLDFDPSGALIEVKQGATVVFSRTFEGAASGPTTCDVLEINPDLVNTGAAPAGSGDARYRVDADCEADFSVEVEDLPLGDYDVYVAGVLPGEITVIDTGDKVEGGIEFDTDPSEPGKVILLFDPRGKLIEVKQGATTFFTLSFPSN